ncbi:hypothetical protein CGMCC3_g7074 [Colletotrichum fructicola]|uniref:Aspercryptin biosynthesis cluster protein B n=1 Tax=Colletotrichum fructicola (strain Nara gc5) TaxID=1213859 RepID=A0A7J6JK19_COLFN|nr:uncharacterized protein CGMCC3_g7074 [Colletotrichum fructicola]KAE9576894.1 hypothetical protein CGMCC3_g7074 [Colletotrichum fructicola]KAF4413132.1 Aspercryptin biosynthesis cluster protein B [Colletotrichum fructicola]KAF4491096.1 Aspercryptin biosynthesis cluster protein B [Colletotrichum fructicola Nara gc5]KAF5513595.1 Aspercryptin biosynthesis cluster protein B [Colletotrichum fructicola]
MYARTLTFALRTANMSLGAGAGARTMATRAPKEFLCIMPDKPNVLQVRKQVKGQHYEGIKPLIESGRLVAGGAMLERHPKEDATEACFRGSVVVYTAESPEDVKAIIENDVYATSGVWDLERMQIIPYVAAVRQPLSS